MAIFHDTVFQTNWKVGGSDFEVVCLVISDTVDLTDTGVLLCFQHVSDEFDIRLVVLSSMSQATEGTFTHSDFVRTIFEINNFADVSDYLVGAEG